MQRIGAIVGAVLYPVVGCTLGVVVIGSLGWAVSASGVPAIWVAAVVLALLTGISLGGTFVAGWWRRRYPYGVRYGRG